MKLKKKRYFIKLYSGELVEVSAQDYEYLNQFKWCLFKSDKWRYAIRTKNGKTVFMHREIMGVQGRENYVDHRDNDGLNNTRENLRICCNRTNQYNVAKKVTSTQKYKCIRQVSKNSWQVRIRTPKGDRIERRAKTEEGAVELYNELVTKYHGEFAYLQKVY